MVGWDVRYQSILFCFHKAFCCVNSFSFSFPFSDIIKTLDLLCCLKYYIMAIGAWLNICPLYKRCLKIRLPACNMLAFHGPSFTWSPLMLIFDFDWYDATD